MNIDRKEKIKISIACIILVLIISVVFAIVIKYQVDGETNMAFNLSKITIISTAEGTTLKSEDENVRWNEQINQSNDIYLFIDKNEEYKKDAVIENVTIENIKIVKAPSKGTVKTYMPSVNAARIFEYDDRFLVTDSLTYKGAKVSNEKTLEICNQGGRVAVRIANTNLDTYTSNDDAEIKHDGTLITKTGTTQEEIQFKVTFDLIICVNKIKYKTNISLDLPSGNILEEGRSQIEITDLKDTVFKRIS